MSLEQLYVNIEASEEQRRRNNKIAGKPRGLQPEELLKWALERITFYGPLDEPCACAIRSFLKHGEVTSF